MRLEPVNAPAPVTRHQAGRIPDDEARAMARASVRLFDHWSLTNEQRSQLLGGLSASTLRRWREGRISYINTDLATRLSVLMGIHKALRVIFTENERAYAWVSKHNAHFNGERPIDIMTGGDILNLFRVRAYLDALRG